MSVVLQPVSAHPPPLSRLRRRAELFAVAPDGRVFGGVWHEDGGFAVPGGGLEPGEDWVAAALREGAEEAGLVLAGGHLLSVPQVLSPWGVTRYVVADLLSVGGGTGWAAGCQRLYTPAEALIVTACCRRSLSPADAAGRTRALEALLRRSGGPA